MKEKVLWLSVFDYQNEEPSAMAFIISSFAVMILLITATSLIKNKTTKNKIIAVLTSISVVSTAGAYTYSRSVNSYNSLSSEISLRNVELAEGKVEIKDKIISKIKAYNIKAGKKNIDIFDPTRYVAKVGCLNKGLRHTFKEREEFIYRIHYLYYEGEGPKVNYKKEQRHDLVCIFKIEKSKN